MPRPRHTPAQILDELVCANGNGAEAARQLGITRAAVSAAVRRARGKALTRRALGEPETRGRRPVAIDWSEVARLREKGHSQKEIAAKIGVGASTLRRRRGEER